jgi:predicted ester cyclase
MLRRRLEQRESRVRRNRPKEGAMSTEETKAIVGRGIHEIFTTGNLDVMDELFDEDYTFQSGPLGTPRDRKSLKMWFGYFRNAFPDLTSTTEDLIAEGDTVVARVVLRGTHQGPLWVFDPTGKQMEMHGIHLIKVQDGKIKDHWLVENRAAMMMQLGLAPPPTEPMHAPGQAPAATDGGSPEENKQIVRGLLEEGVGKGADDVISELVAPDAVSYNPMPGQAQGAEGIKQRVGRLAAGFDYNLSIQELVAEGDKVGTLSTIKGTHTGDFLGVPATNNEIKMDDMSVMRISGGKVVEWWDELDIASVLQQIGAIPSLRVQFPAPAGAQT